MLGQIPILPALLIAEGVTECDLETSCTKKSQEETEVDDELEEKAVSVSKQTSSTLLDWIASSDKNYMEKAFTVCTEGLANVRIIFF